jgi:hypothetical protein
MSNETRTMLVVLAVCGLLVCGCIVLPLGVGAAFFFFAAQQSEVVARQAELSQREAAAQAVENARAAQVVLQQAVPTPPGGASAPPFSVPGLPPLPQTPDLPTSTGEPAPPTPPNITLPPLGELAGGAGLPEGVRAEVLAVMLADAEARKGLYRSFKQLKQAEEQAKALAATDPFTSAQLAKFRGEMDALMQQLGLTREQIDKIIAEGDKEGW